MTGSRQRAYRLPRPAPAALLALVWLALVLGGAAHGASGRAVDYPSLFVAFHTNDTVTVTLADGTPVGTPSGAPTTISPGTYNVLIDDAAFVSDVQWDLAGPGVKLVTNMSYGEEPSESWVETFLPSSTYTYRDDNRASTVFTFITSSSAAVGSTPTGDAPLTSTTPIVSGTNGKAASTDVVGSGRAGLRGALTGKVDAAGRLTLTSGGKAVGTLRAGLYRLTVTDRSKKAGFTVQELKKVATTVTGAAFTGTRSATITLKAGQWFAYPTFVGKKLYFVVTS